jgi:hypothetical protein
MNILYLRRLLITLHLWIAGLLAPAFLVVAVSGGLYIAGIEGKATQTPLELPAGVQLELGSETFEADVRQLIDSQGLNVDFEYVRGGPDRAQTRPTTRTFLTFQQTPDGIKTALNTPDFPYALLELHKGHGPQAYRYYQILVALALFLAVIGGVTVGLLAKNYRRSTGIALVGGSLVAALLAIL